MDPLPILAYSARRTTSARLCRRMSASSSCGRRQGIPCNALCRRTARGQPPCCANGIPAPRNRCLHGIPISAPFQSLQLPTFFDPDQMPSSLRPWTIAEKNPLASTDGSTRPSQTSTGRLLMPFLRGSRFIRSKTSFSTSGPISLRRFTSTT